MKERIITLVIYRYAHRAEILKNKLEEVGIESEIVDDSTFGQIVGTKVLINNKDFEKASVIYREIRSLYDAD
jgi:putative lipoic acid-binding regulatory protein